MLQFPSFVWRYNLIFISAETPEDRPTCNVDGKLYKDGEHFSVDSKPDLSCVCQEGYEGETNKW